MDAKQKFQRLIDVERKRAFERLTGEDRQRGGFSTNIRPVHGPGSTRAEAWTPAMSVPVRATFMGHESPAKKYSAAVRDQEWRAKMAKREARVMSGSLNNLHAKQDQQLVALQAALRMQLGRLSPAQRAKHVANALFGTAITPERGTA